MKTCNPLLKYPFWKFLFRSTFFLILFSGFLQAQDPTFSQFFANRIQLNPAFTGLDRGITLSATGRSQWFALDKGYQLYNASVEWQEPVLNSGIGFNIYGSYDGLLNYNTTSVGLNYAYIISWPDNNLHIGLQARWIQHRINWDRAIFSDQIDPILGNVNPTSADISNDRTSHFDFDIGLIWRFDAGQAVNARSYSNHRYAIGIAIHHLPSLFGAELGGNNSILGLSSNAPPRFTFHFGALYPITFFRGTRRGMTISPQLKMEFQGTSMFDFSNNFQNSQIGAFVMWGALYSGLFYQDKWPVPTGGGNTNAIIIQGGVQFGDTNDLDYLIGLSIDLNLAGVSISSGMIYELTFRYNFEAFIGFARRPGHKNSILKCDSFL